MSKKKRKEPKLVDGAAASPLTEDERLALIEQWENQPSPNPEYEGMTPADAARGLFAPRKERDV